MLSLFLLTLAACSPIYNWTHHPVDGRTDPNVRDEMSSRPYGMYGVSMVLMDDALYLFGGRYDALIVNMVTRLNVDSPTNWISVGTGNVPAHRYFSSIARIDGTRFVIFGGDLPGINLWGADLWELDTFSKEWTALASEDSLPEEYVTPQIGGRAGALMWLHSNILYFALGFGCSPVDCASHQITLEDYPIWMWNLSGNPGVWEYHNVSVSPSGLGIQGKGLPHWQGVVGSPESLSTYLYIYGGTSCVVVRMLVGNVTSSADESGAWNWTAVAGGSCDGNYTNDGWRGFPRGRRFADAQAPLQLGGMFGVVFGGYAPGLGQLLGDLWLYDCAADVWRWVEIEGTDGFDYEGSLGDPSFPAARRAAAAVTFVRNGIPQIWIFGGWDFSDEFADTWSMELELCQNGGQCSGMDTCDFCICSYGWAGRMCDEVSTCHGIQFDNSSFVCSGNGICSEQDLCACFANWTGMYCNETVTCSSIEWTNDSFVCGGHGQCVAVDSCDCQAGYVPDAEGHCLSCPSRFFCPGDNSPYTCNGLPGKYCPEGSDQPEECVSGHYCQGDGLMFSCAEGVLCNETGSGEEGQLCPEGMFCSNNGTTWEVATCEPGYWCPEGSIDGLGRRNAFDSPRFCREGSYCEEGSATSDGSGVCVDGYRCPEGSSSSTESLCPAGSFCLRGFSHDCPEGTFSSVDAVRSACEICPAGSYCTGGQPFLCAETGEFCERGQSSPLPCPADETCVNGSLVSKADVLYKEKQEAEKEVEVIRVEKIAWQATSLSVLGAIGFGIFVLCLAGVIVVVACCCARLRHRKPVRPVAPTLTFCFTDIYNSTVLHNRLPNEMRIALSQHDAVARRLLTQMSGYEIKTIGDAFFVCFLDPADALNWAMAFEEALLEVSWPERLLRLHECSLVTEPKSEEEIEEERRQQPRGVFSIFRRRQALQPERTLFRGLRVRIGIHMGRKFSPLFNRTWETYDFVGATVNRCSRIESVAPPGQIFISSEVRDAVQHLFEDADGLLCHSAGHYRLKGFQGKYLLYSVCCRRLSSRFSMTGLGADGMAERSSGETNSSAAVSAVFERARSCDIPLKRNFFEEEEEEEEEGTVDDVGAVSIVQHFEMASKSSPEIHLMDVDG